MKIPDIEVRPSEIWRLRFRTTRIFGIGRVDEGVLKHLIEERIKEIGKFEFLSISPVIEDSFYVIVRVTGNPIKLATLITAIIAAGLAAGFVTVTFVSAEKIAPAIAYGMEIGIIIIAAAIAIIILSGVKK